MKINQEGNQFFIIMEDGAKQMIIDAPINFQLTMQAALPDGLIVPAGLALGVARAETMYWKNLAEKRGEELANLRSKG